jgi:hypothetical protein
MMPAANAHKKNGPKFNFQFAWKCAASLLVSTEPGLDSSSDSALIYGGGS